MTMTHKRGCILCITLLLSISTVAQFPLYPTSARNVALGGIYCSPLPTEHATLSVSYRSDYSMRELSTKNLEAHIKTSKYTTAHLSYSHFGDTAYHEQSMTAGIGVKVTRKTNIEGSIHLFHIGGNNPKYDSERYPSLGLMAYSQPSHNTLIHLLYLHAPWLDKHPYIVRASFCYKPVASTTTIIELEHYITNRFHLGCEYELINRFYLRGGLLTSPLQYTFGIGWNKNLFAIDIAVQTHSILGLTTQISATVCL